MTHERYSFTGTPAEIIFKRILSANTEASTQRRQIASSREVAANAITYTGGDHLEAGKILHDTWTALPTDDAAWIALGVPPYLEDPRGNGSAAILGALGTHADLAAGFYGEVDDNSSLFAVGTAEMAVQYAWNVPDSDPLAGAIATKALADSLSAAVLKEMLELRYKRVSRTTRYGAKPPALAIADYGKMLTILKAEGYLPPELGVAVQAHHSEVIADVARARKLWEQILDTASPR